MRIIACLLLLFVVNVAARSCGVADIVFLIDSSSSITGDGLHNDRFFLKNFTHSLNIDNGDIQVSIVTYAAQPTVEVRFDQARTTQELDASIDKIQYLSGHTYTDRALNYVVDNIFTVSQGARPYAKKVLIVITDGQSHSHATTSKAAERVHSHNIEAFVVGVIGSANIDELLQIATDTNHLFLADRHYFYVISNQLRTAMCNSHFADNSTCYDENDECSSYGQKVCTLLVPWAKSNCKRFCGFCNVNAVSSPTSSSTSQTMSTTNMKTSVSTASTTTASTNGTAQWLAVVG